MAVSVVIGIKTISRCLLATALSWVVAGPARAVDGMAIEAGHYGHTNMVRVAAQWQWSKRWLQRHSWHLGGYWDLSIAQWERDGVPGTRAQLADLGITPVFRWQADDLQGFYLEGGIGAHWLTPTQLGDKRFGSNFQFGDHLGFGYRFGANRAVDLSYRYQHLSNADIKRPNDGINIHQVRLQYWFQ